MTECLPLKPLHLVTGLSEADVLGPASLGDPDELPSLATYAARPWCATSAGVVSAKWMKVRPPSRSRSATGGGGGRTATDLYGRLQDQVPATA